MAKIVSVLAVPTSAYRPARAASSLLKSQILILQRAVLRAVDTEGEAVDAIRTLTQLLHRLQPRIMPERHGATKKPRPTRAKRGGGGGAIKRAVKKR